MEPLSIPSDWQREKMGVSIRKNIEKAVFTILKASD